MDFVEIVINYLGFDTASQLFNKKDLQLMLQVLNCLVSHE